MGVVSEGKIPIAMRCSSSIPMLVTLLLTCGTSKAQHLFDIGLKGGVNMDDLATHYKHDPVLGAHAGLFARIKPPLLPGVQGELLLTSLGSDVWVEGYSAEIRTVAMRTPLFLVWGLGPVELHAGAYFEHYLTDDLVRNFDVPIDDVPVELADLSEDGYGLLFGGGVHMGHFYGGVRYNMGLSALGRGPYLEDVKNRQWQAYVGFGFMSSK